ncbi:MAG: tail fiber domain-containing protein [Candidatus Thorarchaeota archaeon]|jgi:hypothetical protein
MKAKTIFCFLTVLFAIVTGSNAQERGPVAISPGSEGTLAIIFQNCPTFSWTSVEWAVAYRLAIFEMTEQNVLTYEEMEAMASPILIKNIKGRALSWTPSSFERLGTGRKYIWYVQALDGIGRGLWSEGSIFRVDGPIRFDGVEEEIREKLERQGMSEEAIEEVLEDMRSGTRDVMVWDVDAEGIGDGTPGKIGIQGLEIGSNTLFGENAGFSLATGTGAHNTFMGYQAGYLNADGEFNTFMGYQAGYNNTTDFNTFIGFSAGLSNDSGTNNTFIGESSGLWNTTGTDNTFVGQRAGYGNIDGLYNTYVGQNAGFLSDSGSFNTFIGRSAGHSNDEGVQNTFVGFEAGYTTTSGNANTFIGTGSGSKNDTGSANTFLGRRSGASNTVGEYNTFIGTSAGGSNTEGNGNTYIGQSTGYNNMTGTGNVFLGYHAGLNATGSNKLFIDNSSTNSPLIWGNFSTDILAVHGRLGVGTKSPTVQMEIETTGEEAILFIDRTDGATTGFASLGDFGALGTVTNHPFYFVINGLARMILRTNGSLQMSSGARCTAAGVWTDASSRDYKENIQEISVDDAINTLEGLKPVRYNYKRDKDEEYMGFIAEDVPNLVASNDRKSMSPMDVVAVLTKVVQEQQKTITYLQKQIDELKSAPRIDK